MDTVDGTMFVSHVGNHIDGTIGKPRLWVTRNACKKARGNYVVGLRVRTLKQRTRIIFNSRVRPRDKATESHVGRFKRTTFIRH